jgi:molybdopterin molybdotransferase
MNEMISPDEALRLVIEAARPLPTMAIPSNEAVGTALAEAEAADRDEPPFDRAMMDGYAVRLADAGGRARVVGEIAAGTLDARVLIDGEAVEIMTGAPCPQGSEAVVAKEDARRDGDRVALPAAVRAEQNIARRGVICRAGETILEPGTAITPLVVGALASAGRAEVRVVARPRMAIVVTGEEVVAGTPGPAQIRDSNGPMLAAMARGLGLVDVRVAHARDTAESLRAALDEVDEVDVMDIVVLTGGVSTGKYDIVPTILEERGARRVFHKVAQRPGKPLFFASRAREGNAPQLYFGLPGNPLSCHLCFHRYVASAARKMMGLPAVTPPLIGLLTETFEVGGGRVVFQLARARRDADGTWRVMPLRGRGSADLIHPATANTIVRFDPGCEAEGGRSVLFELLHGER